MSSLAAASSYFGVTEAFPLIFASAAILHSPGTTRRATASGTLLSALRSWASLSACRTGSRQGRMPQLLELDVGPSVWGWDKDQCWTQIWIAERDYPKIALDEAAEWGTRVTLARSFHKPIKSVSVRWQINPLHLATGCLALQRALQILNQWQYLRVRDLVRSRLARHRGRESASRAHSWVQTPHSQGGHRSQLQIDTSHVSAVEPTEGHRGSAVLFSEVRYPTRAYQRSFVFRQ